MLKQQRDLSGILFKNTQKESPSQPDYRGEVTAAGIPYKISAWIKDGANGKFMSLALTLKEAPKEAAVSAADKSQSHADDLNDPLPF